MEVWVLLYFLWSTTLIRTWDSLIANIRKYCSDRCITHAAKSFLIAIWTKKQARSQPITYNVGLLNDSESGCKCTVYTTRRLTIMNTNYSLSCVILCTAWKIMFINHVCQRGNVTSIINCDFHRKFGRSVVHYILYIATRMRFTSFFYH